MQIDFRFLKRVYLMEVAWNMYKNCKYWFHQFRDRGYNKKCVLYLWTWVGENNFCRFICVINDGPYTLL